MATLDHPVKAVEEPSSPGVDIDEDEEGNLLKEEDEESVVAVGVPFVVTASGSIVMAILVGRNDDVVKERRMILTTMEVMFRILAVELDDCEDERRNIFMRM